MLLCNLEIKNYGYWSELEIPFADDQGKPYSTILLHGEQNSGKSSIVRSLRWLMYGDLWENPQKKFPNSWKKEFKEAQYVRASFSGTKESYRHQTRTPAKGVNKTAISLIIDGNELSEEVAFVTWERLFGSSARRRCGIFLCPTDDKDR